MVENFEYARVWSFFRAADKQGVSMFAVVLLGNCWVFGGRPPFPHTLVERKPMLPRLPAYRTSVLLQMSEIGAYTKQDKARSHSKRMPFLLNTHLHCMAFFHSNSIPARYSQPRPFELEVVRAQLLPVHGAKPVLLYAPSVPSPGLGRRRLLQGLRL